MNETLREAKRLYDLNFAVHWIKPNSKAPVKEGWSGPIRDPWAVLQNDYREGFGLGVRLGESSNIGDGYLANIDIDIKSNDPRHAKEALDFFKKRFPGLTAPTVTTGYGQRLFIKTLKPLKSGKLGSSNEETKVYLPTTPINKRQQKAVADGLLTEGELSKGYRIRPAWEVEFMSAGRQVVLPPSVHPETKKPYLWSNGGLKDTAQLPLVNVAEGAVSASKGNPPGFTTIQNFEARDVDLSRLNANIQEMIISGQGIDDRSSALLSASMSMVKAGYEDIDVLSVLTDQKYFLGEVAFEHRCTKSRAAAAAWIRDYTLKKAKHEVGAVKAFELAVEITPTLADDEAKLQIKEMVTDFEDPKDWKGKLTRTQKGQIQPTLRNIELILMNAVSPKVFKRDEFSGREFYGCNAPWTGGEKGKALSDDDAIAIKAWVSSKFGVEPGTNIIFEVMNHISNKNKFHPIREELEALPPWDFTERLDTWLADNFEAKGDPKYLAEVFRKWMVASVTRIYRPGTKFDWLPILEGAQGTGKSSFGTELFHPQYCSDWMTDLANKDAALGLQGIRCHEFSELDSMHKNEVNTIKAFVTRTVDKVRPHYGRKTIEMPRQCVFFGTTNSDDYLRDETGNRRFNPVKVGWLNFEAIRRDRDQLWAEALFIYKNELEDSLYLSTDAEAHAVIVREDKLVHDEFMVDSFAEFLTKEALKPENERFDFSKFKLTTLFKTGGPFQEINENYLNLRSAVKIMKKYSFENFRVKGNKWWRSKGGEGPPGPPRSTP